ncbi:hypothetical protein CHS0354_002093 [Potamilus streckersoni]|uniref:HTH lacI-type domain-containing protein n=1 Tax=Potamilus streckersoni TaxID=2493646 RepID=A0AAE0T6Q7_9BIVA|nr:hypothetical protein CHS0354_002093 [Potamilus streckersoni]
MNRNCKIKRIRNTAPEFCGAGLLCLSSGVVITVGNGALTERSIGELYSRKLQHGFIKINKNTAQFSILVWTNWHDSNTERCSNPLGYSIKTASRVINGEERVRPDTKRKVLQAIRDCGYIRSQAARVNAERSVRHIWVYYG